MDPRFEWDPLKAELNERKHGVTFEEASSVFGDPLSASMQGFRHSATEHRYILIGRSEQGRLLAVMHTERIDRVRIISARLATPRERREYEEGLS